MNKIWSNRQSVCIEIVLYKISACHEFPIQVSGHIKYFIFFYSSLDEKNTIFLWDLAIFLSDIQEIQTKTNENDITNLNMVLWVEIINHLCVYRFIG